MSNYSPTWKLLFNGALLCVAWTFSYQPSLLAEDPPGTSLLGTVDLAVGPDAYLPYQLAINHTTRKLYVPALVAGADAFPPRPDASYAVKVIDTTTNAVIGGIDLGLYDFGGGSKLPFQPYAIAVDESSTAGGNKIYVLGSVGGDPAYVRVIDGATDANETGQGTDVLLPESGIITGFYAMTANPVNHKIYAATGPGHVAVIDGPNHVVLTTVLGSFGFGSPALVANPATNKVFVFGSHTEEVIDSSDDSFITVPISYIGQAAAFDPGTGRIFAVGITNTTTDSALYAMDGSTGALIQSQGAVPPDVQGITVDSSAGLVYLGQPADSANDVTGKLAAFNADNLVAAGTFPDGAAKLALDGAGTSKQIYLIDYDYYFANPVAELRNTVGVLNPANGSLEKVTVGYSPDRIAVNPKSNRVYVADGQAPELTVLDGATRAVIARVATGPAGSRDLAVSVALNRIYLARVATTDATTLEQTSYVDVYDGENTELTASIVVETDSFVSTPVVAVDDTRRRLYVGAQSAVKVYDLNSHQLINTIPLPNRSTEMAVNPVTGLLYFSSTSNTVMIVDPGTDIVVQVPTQGLAAPGPIAVNVKTNRIFVVKTGFDNEVTVINGATGEIETTIQNTTANAGDAVTSVAVDDVTNNIYLGDDSGQLESTGRVTAFDGNDNYAFLGQIDVGRYPERLAFNTATRQLFVSNNQDGTLSVLQNSTSAPPDLLANISTRLGVQTDDNVLIGGFIITGPAGSMKQVIVRGIGPSLTAFGVSGALADPVLELHSGAATIATNDNWKIDEHGKSQQAAVQATGLAPTSDLESAIVMNLAPGSYTAILRGASEGTGVGLVEVYDLSASVATQMANISTRGRVETGDAVMIGGVIVTGANASRVIVRAIGPSLTGFGVGDALQDPVLELHDAQGALITLNEDWKDENQAEIEATGLAPMDDRESAIVATLYPALYTAIVRGTSDTAGVGLVEVYHLP